MSGHWRGDRDICNLPPSPAASVVQGVGELREAIRARIAQYGGVIWNPGEAADAVLALPEVARLLAERDQAQAAVRQVRELADRSFTAPYRRAVRHALDGPA